MMLVTSGSPAASIGMLPRLVARNLSGDQPRCPSPAPNRIP